MTKIIAYIGLGSNLGRRMANLEEAVDRLHHREGVHVTRLSPVYETAPGRLCEPAGFFKCLCGDQNHPLPDGPVAYLIGCGTGASPRTGDAVGSSHH